MPQLEDPFPAVYEELKRIARRHRRGIGSRGTLSTTELVHEAYLKLARHSSREWHDRAHFIRTASRAMRQVLVDHARRRNALKRGGGAWQVSLGHADSAMDFELEQVLVIDAALTRLDALNPRLREVVELRYFAGLQVGEAADALGVTARTIERDWTKARLFLLRELDAGGNAPRMAR